MAALAVAALSARALAEAAATEGHEVLALDLFGDLDTCRAANRWWALGSAAGLRIEAAPFCEALRLAARHGASGWIAGSGFEAEPALLDAGAALLPLIGNSAAVLRQVGDAQQFFGCLDAHDLPHPEVQFRLPNDASGWLLKDSAGSGGWRVRPLASASADAAAWAGQPLPPGLCCQRQVPGRPVSATFVANGHEASVLGFNQQRVQAIAGRPYVFAGIVGPLALPAAAEALLRRALAVLVPQFGLRGLGSLDAMLDGDRISLLEVNPRPPASLSLYPDSNLIHAHLQACQQGRLPAAPAHRPRTVYGQAIVFAPQPLRLGTAAADLLAAWPQAHDLPVAGTPVASGSPLCSLGASGDDAAAVHAQLNAQTDRLLTALCSLPET